MSMIIQTTIKNLRDGYREAQEWVDNGGLLEDWDELEECENNGTLVTIVSEETDGYMNIKLPSGRFVDALNVHHLSGFNDDATNTINWRTLLS